jgi:hypothetical protein
MPGIRRPQIGDQVPPSGGEQVGVGAGEPQSLRLLGREAQGEHRAVVRRDLARAAPRRGGQVLDGPPGQHAPVGVGHIQRGEARWQQGALPPPARIEVAQEPGTGHDAVPAVHARRRYQNRSCGHSAVLLAQILGEPTRGHGLIEAMPNRRYQSTNGALMAHASG